jgi:hypothetical protein
MRRADRLLPRGKIDAAWAGNLVPPQSARQISGHAKCAPSFTSSRARSSLGKA